MRILCENGWRRGFLDYHRPLDEYRVSVRLWKRLSSFEQAYPRRPRGVIDSARIILQYIRHSGFVAVLKIAADRRRELHGGQRDVACGLGRIIDGPEVGLRRGQTVAFLAPCHPRCVERLVLPRALIAEVDEQVLEDIPVNALLYFSSTPMMADIEERLEGTLGWSRFSGRPSPSISPWVIAAACCPRGRDKNLAQRLDISEPERIQEVRHASLQPPRRSPSAILIGYGQQARTLVMPSVQRHLAINRVHEIDPLRVRPADGAATWTTSAEMPATCDLRGEVAAFIAGYHESHARLAEAALRQNLYAVIEKPAATTVEGCDRLLAAMSEYGNKVFVCFHKRYHPFNALATADMGAEDGAPISYHCIVYEEPLPKQHWYRWPSSRSRIVSNGCHWIDHFLFLNGYAYPVSVHAEAVNESINCSIALENGACFTMVLSDWGSPRKGVRNYVELRTGRRTVRITDDTQYVAEDERRVIRRSAVDKIQVYFGMYDQIARTISRRQEGDSARCLETSTRLVLALDQQITDAIRTSQPGGSGG